VPNDEQECEAIAIRLRMLRAMQCIVKNCNIIVFQGHPTCHIHSVELFNLRIGWAKEGHSRKFLGLIAAKDLKNDGRREAAKMIVPYLSKNHWKDFENDTTDPDADTYDVGYSATGMACAHVVRSLGATANTHLKRVEHKRKGKTRETDKYYSRRPSYKKYTAKIMDDRHTTLRRGSKTISKPTEYAIYRNDRNGTQTTIKEGEEIRVSYSQERNKGDEASGSNRWTRQLYELKDECMILDTRTGTFKPHILTPENICTTVREYTDSMSGPHKPETSDDRTYCPRCKRSHDNDKKKTS
jgi:hypothetical protein